MYLSNFDSYTPSASNPIVVKIFGIQNPNVAYTDTGYIKVGLLYTGKSYFLNSNPQAAVLQMYDRPGWLKVNSIKPAHKKVRYAALYKLNFTMDNTVPKILSKGSVFIDFPAEFDNISDGRVTCSTPTALFASVIDCAVVRNRFNITGNTEDYSGVLVVTLSAIENPIKRGASNNFFVSSYDGINKIIIDRSYTNLDPFTFTYIYPGPLIHVHGDSSITIYPGTQTVDLFVTTDYEAQLELSIKPDVLAGFKLIPYNIPIHLG